MEKKNLAASEWQNFLLFSSPCKQRCSFFSSSDIFSILFFFPLRHSVQKKMCCNCALGLELVKNKMKLKKNLILIKFPFLFSFSIK